MINKINNNLSLLFLQVSQTTFSNPQRPQNIVKEDTSEWDQALRNSIISENKGKIFSLDHKNLIIWILIMFLI